MAVTYSHTDDGAELSINLTAQQVAALGDDADQLGRAVDSLLTGLAAMRAGQPSKDDTARLLTDLDMLGDQLAALYTAAVRRHAELGGTYGELANAMGVARSTAQRRRDTVMQTPPSEREQWATGRQAVQAGHIHGDITINGGTR